MSVENANVPTSNSTATTDIFDEIYDAEATYGRASLMDAPNAMGLLLAATFHDDKNAAVSAKFDSLYRQIYGHDYPDLATTGNTVEQNLQQVAVTAFAEAISEWSELTKKTELNLNNLLLEKLTGDTSTIKNNIRAFTENVEGQGSTGRPDIVLAPLSTTAHWSAIIEVGILDPKTENAAKTFTDLYWKKLDQGSKYVLSTGKENVPVMLFVIVISRGEVAGVVEPKYKFGAYLCKPKSYRDGSKNVDGTNKLTLSKSLLWRMKANETNDAACGFGKMVLSSFRIAQLQSMNSTTYKRLGPSCCRVGETVWRCYDSRQFGTFRKPYMYKDNGGVANPPTPIALLYPKDICSVLVEYADTNFNENTFGNIADRNCNRNAIWECKGKALVLQVPYFEGDHVAKAPTDFVPVILHLFRLHRQGYVHGDIRAFNMLMVSGECTEWSKSITVNEQGRLIKNTGDAKNEQDVSSDDYWDELFSDEWNDGISDKGRLIDFDYSGKNGTAVYPHGYVKNLPDCIRLTDTGNILPSHDWYALASVMFDKHEYKHANVEERKWVFGNITELQNWMKKWICLDDFGCVETMTMTGDGVETIAMTTDVVETMTMRTDGVQTMDGVETMTTDAVETMTTDGVEAMKNNLKELIVFLIQLQKKGIAVEAGDQLAAEMKVINGHCNEKGTESPPRVPDR